MTGRKRSKDLRRIMGIAEEGDAGTAILLLRRRVDADPSAVESRACLAEVLLQSGDAPSALSEARTALGLDPSSESAAGVAAAAALAIGRVSVILDFGRELVAARPHEPDAYRALMRLSAGVGDLYEAALAAEWLVDSLDDGEAAAVLQDIAHRAGLDAEDEAADGVASAVEGLLDEPLSDEDASASLEPMEDVAPAPGLAEAVPVGVADDVEELMSVELVPALPEVPSDSSDEREEPVPLEESVPLVPTPYAVGVDGLTATPDTLDEVPVVPPPPEVLAEKLRDRAAGDEEAALELLVPIVGLPGVPSVEAVSATDLDEGVVDDPTLFVPPIPSGTSDAGAQDSPSDDATEPSALAPPLPADDVAPVAPHGRSATEPHGGESFSEGDDSDGPPDNFIEDWAGDGQEPLDTSGESTIDEDGPSRFGEQEEVDLRALADPGGGMRTRRWVNAT